MAERLKLLVSFDVHNGEPQIHARTKGMGMWFVKLFAANLDEEVEVEMQNDLPVDLMLMQPLVYEQFTQIMGELSPVTEGSFHIYQRKL